MPEYKRSEAKQWARDRYRGLETVLLPSLKEEVTEEGSTWNLDEAGIRHDVEMCKKHGFFMCTAAIEGGTFMMMEYMLRDFWEIVVDQAAGEILVDAYISANTLEDLISTAQLAQDCGVDAMMLAYPPYFYPKNGDEVVEFTQKVCESVDLAVTAYATHKPNFERFHNSTFDPRLLSRIADIENVAAMKLGVIDPSHNYECFQRFGKKILPAAVFPDLWNVFVPACGQQWAGSAPYEVFQDPDKRYLVDQFTLLTQGRYDEAMELHWKLYPCMKTIWKYAEPTIYEGNYNVMHWKYWGWLAGMNGGPMTLPISRMYEHQKEEFRQARRILGLSVPENDEEFYVGRVNYGKPGGA
ncbi:MAG: dihydrodipicolinate synthase family protein [Proteobacteria bacterium]|nr:dihydrodipicolinate synthase family protein [Pseudomonadota bacterium]